MENVFEFVSKGRDLRIGKFIVRNLSDGSTWIENEIGEGAQLKTELVEAAIKKLFDDNF